MTGIVTRLDLPIAIEECRAAAKTDSSGSNAYLRASSGLIGSIVSDGAATYTPGVSEKRGTTSTYYHADIKNSVEQTSTGQGVAASRQYDAFGNEVSSSGPWQGPFQYGGAFGYHTDSDYGLKHLGARYYDSTTSRFLSRDPIKDGRNWYAYAEGDPVASADPDGLLPMGVAPGGLPQSAAQPPPWWDTAANFSAGWGDMLTFGGTYLLREMAGLNDVIDGSSGAYRAGVAVGVAHGLALRGATANPRIGQFNVSRIRVWQGGHGKPSFQWEVGRRAMARLEYGPLHRFRKQKAWHVQIGSKRGSPQYPWDWDPWVPPVVPPEEEVSQPVAHPLAN